MWLEERDRETAAALRRDENNPAITRMSRVRREKLGKLCGRKQDEVKGDRMMGVESAALKSMTSSLVELLLQCATDQVFEHALIILFLSLYTSRSYRPDPSLRSSILRRGRIRNRFQLSTDALTHSVRASGYTVGIMTC